jgi:FkbM family methyltransferase
MIELGRGESFRRASVLERTARACGRLLGDSPLRRTARRAWDAVLDRLPGDRLVCVFPGGERIRLAAAHRHVTWNLQEYDAFRQSVRAGDTVLDIGANLGAYSLLFGHWVGPSGLVHAFEPAPLTRAGLARHVGINGFDDRVRVHGEAVTQAEGRARFLADGLHGDNRLTGGSAGPGSVEIATTSIDAFCRHTGRLPSLIKVDVEGAELDVLRGARETIAAAGPGLALYVEMHPHLWPSFGVTREAVEGELARQGLCPERLDGQPDVWNIEGVCLRLRRCAS